MPPPGGGAGLARYGSAPGSLLAAIAHYVTRGGEAAALAPLGAVIRFFSGDSSRRPGSPTQGCARRWRRSCSRIPRSHGGHRAQGRGFSFPSPATAGMRSLQTIIEVSNNASDEHSQDLDDSKTDTPPASVPTVESSFKVRGTSNLKISPRHDLAMIFTCKVCETRSMKMASRESYEKGVVVARCGGCNNLHLIADRLGWFGEPGSIEDFLAEQGEEVKKGSTETLNFTLEDLVGSQVNSKDPSGQN